MGGSEKKENRLSECPSYSSGLTSWAVHHTASWRPSVPLCCILTMSLLQSSMSSTRCACRCFCLEWSCSGSMCSVVFIVTPIITLFDQLIHKLLALLSTAKVMSMALRSTELGLGYRHFLLRWMRYSGSVLDLSGVNKP